MPDETFYVGAVDKNKNFSGFVPARFLTIRDCPIVDPIPGGSHDFYVYADDRGNGKTHAKIANPNNYVVVPGNFTEAQARAYAGHIDKLQSIPAIGTALD